jgi:hemerythrin superfamily protein
MDALQILRNDHRRVRELFRQFDEAQDPSTRMAVVDETVAELLVHAQLEEEIFYPAMERQGLTDLVDHAEEEHQLADTIMQELMQMDARNGQLEPKFRVLIDTVTEHVTEEESQMFPRAAEIGLDRLEEIGAEIERLRARILQEGQPAARAAANGVQETSRAAGSGRARAGRSAAAAGATGASRAAARSGGKGAGSRSTRNARDKARSRKTGTRSARSSGGNGRGGLDSMTREELYQRAQKADIAGRSQMNKKELARALSRSK